MLWSNPNPTTPPPPPPGHNLSIKKVTTNLAEMPEYNNKTCADCEHLCIINRNKIYAVCDETGKAFELWHMDTRTTDACKKFISKVK